MKFSKHSTVKTMQQNHSLLQKIILPRVLLEFSGQMKAVLSVREMQSKHQAMILSLGLDLINQIQF